MHDVSKSIIIALHCRPTNNSLKWYFCFIHSFHNKSIARYRFYYPGDFIVRVSVSNHLQQLEPLIVSHPDVFIVQAPLIPATLDLLVFDNSLGAPLLQNIGGTAEVTFVAVCEGSHVVFDFDYGDGRTEVVQGGSGLSYSQAFGRHVFTQGKFTWPIIISGNILVAFKSTFEKFSVVSLKKYDGPLWICLMYIFLEMS